MLTYILLMTLTPEGQKQALTTSDHILAVESEIEIDGVETLGVYAVLGEYDFVTLVEAESNEAVARFSIELGVKAGVHVTTLPAVPIARMESSPGPSSKETAEIASKPPSA